MNLLRPLYEGIFGTTAHWNYHAWLMFTIWIVLIPAVLLLTRFNKPAPTLEGIPKGSAKLGRKLFWFTMHRVGLSALATASVSAVSSPLPPTEVSAPRSIPCSASRQWS